jgi:hypothetical protein
VCVVVGAVLPVLPENNNCITLTIPKEENDPQVWTNENQVYIILYTVVSVSPEKNLQPFDTGYL